ncbi:DNA polymerase III subunit delta [Weissella diestrammenae]|uniref:DNA polymerase III subunit delta n=1 Tax=Weissella diestrammenae TaxID=1162633 RepID=A0A7G9T4D7_9LACO|nr:DNA polymerase III subunit delta [Weissella diestrammenae]MCM0583498.1 DNA polymerase III subunit delta [Weissella diestrammenae]QNN74962.1 DNA polymerase III subunit delta [Weissella diestrammenae]
MAVTLQTIQNDLSDAQTAPVYLIQGTDQYLLDQARQLFVNSVPKEDQAMNLAQFDMHEVPLSVALDDARSMPFFGDKRTVLIDNAFFLSGEQNRYKIEHQVDELLLYLDHPEPQTTLVIFAPYDKLDRRKKVTKRLQEQSQHLAFGELTEKDILGMIQHRLRTSGYDMTNEAQQLLGRLTNYNLTVMMSELDKLMLFAVNDKKITETMVSASVTKTLNESIFDLIDLLLQKKLSQAVNLYHQLLVSGEEPLRLHGAMLSQFRLLLQVKAATTSEQGTATALKVHPYRVKLARQTGRKLAYKNIAQAYLGLVDMEKQLKRTARDPELLFELFVLRYQTITA